MSGSKIFIPILIVLIFFGSLAAEDKSYKINHVNIEAQINADGSMRVKETRTFAFKGKFSYRYRTFPKTGPVEFLDFKVKEGGIEFQESDSRESGTLFREEDNKNISLTWFITARNEIRTFQLSYLVQNAVKKYQDTAVLYYQFISPEWTEHQYDVMIYVRTPGILNRYQVKHWLHGPPWAQSRLEYDGSITVLCEKLPRRNFLEIRALYPPETFPQAPLLEGFIEESISQEESFWADEANARREEWEQKKIVQEKFHKIGRWLIPILSALLFAIWIMLFRRFGKRPLVKNQGDLLAEAPDDTPPALVGYLMNSRTISGSCLIATIMDMAVRGILKFKHEEFERKPGKYKQEYSLELIREVFNNSREKLQDYETELIDFLFDEIAENGDVLDIKKLKKETIKIHEILL